MAERNARPDDEDEPRPREIDLDAFYEVPIPYPRDEFMCPSPTCGRSIELRKQIILAKPARFAHELNDVLKCPYCGIIFSPRIQYARVMRT